MVPMNGQEIAVELGITRQAVSNTLKRAMKKVYLKTRTFIPGTPFETATDIMIMFNVGNTEEEIKEFFKLFPSDIRKEIESDAARKNKKRK